MQIDQSGCAVLGRDIQQNLIIQYSLTETPNNKWSRIFNLKQQDYSFTIRSIFDNENNHSILVIIQEDKVESTPIISILEELVERTNIEFQNDQLKEQILINNMINGLIVMHSEMSFIENNIYLDDTSGKSEFEIYLQKVVSRLNTQQYQDYLNSKLVV